MIDYRIDATRQLIISTTSERLDFFAVSQLIDRLMLDPEFQPGFDSLVILREPTAVPSLADLRLLGPVVTAWSERRAGARWAFVLPTPLALGMAALALEHLALTFVHARCFSTEQAALAWLAQGQIDAAIQGSAGSGPSAGSTTARRDLPTPVPTVVPMRTRKADGSDEVRPFQKHEPR